MSSSAFPPPSMHMHWPLKLSTSPVPGKVQRALECKFMWVNKHLGKEVEMKVDDTVLVMCWKE